MLFWLVFISPGEYNLIDMIQESNLSTQRLLVILREIAIFVGRIFYILIRHILN